MATVDTAQIESKPQKKYDTPFEELQEILKEYLSKDISKSLESIINEVENFKNRLISNNVFLEIEKEHFGINVSNNIDTLDIKPKNLFTACILFGKYVPIFFLGNEHFFVFDDGSLVYYDTMSGKYILENSINYRNLSELTDEDLNHRLHVAHSGLFTVLYQENKKRSLDKLENFRKDNPGVPDYAIELIVGKNYDGRADGDFEVKTINNKLWFIPLSSCVDFDEI